MQRRVERALVAKVGAIVFAGALGLAAILPGAGAQASVMVASVETLAPIEVAGVAATLELPEVRVPLAARGVAFADLVSERPVETAGGAGAPAADVAETASEPPATAVAAVIVAAPLPPPEPLVLDGVVLASWYGPGFYGNRTACGHTYTPEIFGVAHRLLPCGTQVRITSSAGITVVVPVIDRGPYVAGRSLDLSNATKLALGCTDLCRVAMTVIR
jgi:rare lipoprotein A (peptidoglycan hydrolase)